MTLDMFSGRGSVDPTLFITVHPCTKPSKCEGRLRIPAGFFDVAPPFQINRLRDRCLTAPASPFAPAAAFDVRLPEQHVLVPQQPRLISITEPPAVKPTHQALSATRSGRISRLLSRPGLVRLAGCFSPCPPPCGWGDEAHPTASGLPQCPWTPSASAERVPTI